MEFYFLLLRSKVLCLFFFSSFYINKTGNDEIGWYEKCIVLFIDFRFVSGQNR